VFLRGRRHWFRKLRGNTDGLKESCEFSWADPIFDSNTFFIYTLYKQNEPKVDIVMQHNVQKWGNSLGVRIPKALAQKAGLSEGTPVEIILGDESIIIRPRRYSLETLLSGVTPENLHREEDTGKPVGREVW